MNLPVEPVIIVNGVPLSLGQAMTVRAALNGFCSTLREEGLGDDEHGKMMTEGYLARTKEVFELMGLK